MSLFNEFRQQYPALLLHVRLECEGIWLTYARDLLRELRSAEFLDYETPSFRIWMSPMIAQYVPGFIREAWNREMLHLRDRRSMRWFKQQAREAGR